MSKRGEGFEDHCRYCGKNVINQNIYCSALCAVEATEKRLLLHLAATTKIKRKKEI